MGLRAFLPQGVALDFNTFNDSMIGLRLTQWKAGSRQS